MYYYVFDKIDKIVTIFVENPLDFQKIDTKKYFPDVVVQGSIADANILLQKMQDKFLTAWKNNFAVCKETIDGNNLVWSSVDLNNEPFNTDTRYQICDPVIGLHSLAIGTDNANKLLSDLKTKLLDFHGLSSVEILDKLPKIDQPNAIGTQTL